jgi:hypothetical protein
MQVIWTYPTTLLSNIGSSISIGDINNDKVADLLVCDQEKNAFSIYYGVKNNFTLNYDGDYTGSSSCAIPTTGFCNIVAVVGNFSSLNGSDVVASATNSDLLSGFINTGTGLSHNCELCDTSGTFQYIRGIGDINGNGFADYGWMSGNVNGNVGYILLGSQGASFGNDYIRITLSTSSSFQQYKTIVGLNLFNQDSYNDFVITGLDIEESKKYAYVVYGGTSRIKGSSISLNYATRSWAFCIEASTGTTGYFKAAQTNINNNAYTDLALIDTDALGLYIFFGGTNINGIVSVSTANIIITTNGVYSYCFKDVAGGGDYNGDGKKEILLGCEPANTINPIMGIIIFGSNSLSGQYYIEDLLNSNRAITLTYPNSQGFSSFTPVRTEFGGDFNNDDYNDIVIAYSNAAKASTTTGGVFVFYGDSTPNLLASPTPSQTPTPTASLSVGASPSVTSTITNTPIFSATPSSSHTSSNTAASPNSWESIGKPITIAATVIGGIASIVAGGWKIYQTCNAWKVHRSKTAVQIEMESTVTKVAVVAAEAAVKAAVAATVVTNPIIQAKAEEISDYSYKNDVNSMQEAELSGVRHLNHNTEDTDTSVN